MLCLESMLSEIVLIVNKYMKKNVSTKNRLSPVSWEMLLTPVNNCCPFMQDNRYRPWIVFNLVWMYILWNKMEFQLVAVGYYLGLFQLLFASVIIFFVAFIRRMIRPLVKTRHVFLSTRSQLEGNLAVVLTRKTIIHHASFSRHQILHFPSASYSVSCPFSSVKYN